MTKLAIVGSGAVSLGFLQRLVSDLKAGKGVVFNEIDIFDKAEIMGVGLPYSPDFAGPEHIFNTVTSEIEAPKVGDFFNFIKSNKLKIERRFAEIFEERFQRKYRERFGDSALDSEPNLAEKQALRAHYDVLFKSFKKRYLNLNCDATHHPRILYGMYASQLFEDAIATIREHGIKVNLRPRVEVTSLTRDKTSGALTVGHVGGYEEFDYALVATGRSFAVLESEDPTYIPSIWPAEEFKARIDQIIAAEIVKRKAAGNDDRVIHLAINGYGLSALDALKTIFRDGVFVEDAKGNLTFTPSEFDGYQIKIDMFSRSGVMQTVQGKSPWHRVLPLGFSQEYKIDQKLISEIARNQEDKVHLWQIILLFAKVIENAYAENGKVELSAMARDFVKLVIKNTAKKEDLTDEKIDQLLLDSKTKNPLLWLGEMQKAFDVKLQI